MSCMLPVPPIELVSLDSDGLHTAHWASAQISTGENRASFNSVFMASVPSTPMQQWQLVQGMQNLKLQAQGTQGTQSQSQWQLVGPGESQWQIVGPTPQVQPKPMQPPQAMQPMPMQATPVTMPPMQAIPGMPPGPFAFGGYGGYSGYGPPCGGPCCRVQRLRVRQQQVPAASQQETLGALIVTITEGSSYDPIFQQVEQTDDQGTCVATYLVSLSGLQRLVAALESGRAEAGAPGDFQELVENLQTVPADKVVFNWECCSSCSEKGFTALGGVGDDPALKLAKVALERGYMVMFSDFSLKALISSWNSEYFGPKPFLQTGVCTGQVQLNFDPKVLKTCSSKQLAKVGELCEEGKAVIHAASNTIVYQLSRDAAQEAERSGAYRLEVLTTADVHYTAYPGYGAVYGGINALGFSQQAGPQQAMGHVLLTYPSGGRMLTSAGHWKELVHLGGVSEEALLRVAERYYGKEYSTNLGAQLQQCADVGSRMKMQQVYAQQCVQSSAPY